MLRLPKTTSTLTALRNLTSLRSSPLSAATPGTFRFMSRLSGKSVLITGASSGIGYSCAARFAAEGCNLIVTARRLERLDELKSKLLAEHPSIKIHTVALDVRDRAQVNKVVADIPAEFNGVDVLVNNAGLVIGLTPLDTVEPEHLDIMLDTNVKGLVYVSQAVMPLMKQKFADAAVNGAPQYGHIINMSSIAGKEAYANGSIYCATKHAVDAITRAMRNELTSHPIKVSAINPGMVETEFSIVRFQGDKDKAAAVYAGITPLSGDDIADIAVFVAGRPPHVEISDLTVFPHGQASATNTFRRQ
ncbi:NAD(P)-binding protein [Ramicandelaber brevisporus]|nr:NAD(P)-binding protein [Ramicandelaber brevisporus]